MLHFYPHGDDAEPAEDCRWIDLVDPTEDEIMLVKQRFGVAVPTQDSLREIEVTSRLRIEGDILSMSAPLIAGAMTDHWKIAPTGFILSPEHLVTVRFADLPAFDTVIDEIGDGPRKAPAEILVRLLEEIVDRAADHLERASETVAAASQKVFFDGLDNRRMSKDTARLRDVMRQIGRASDRTSRVRYMFLSIGRIAGFVIDRCETGIDAHARDRFDAVRHDIASLDEFETSLSGRIQLLQDAATGFISIEQNDVVKLLTVVSVAGVPPVLVVGIYGMNFRYMPELGWHYGYPFALALCLLSIVVPLLWFKWKDWI